MKFTVQPSDLKAAFAAVKSVVPGKPSMPVLENVLLLPVGEGEVSLTATDIDNTIVVKMRVEDAEAVVPFLIPAARLGDFIGNAMGEWPVMVETDDDEIVFSDGFGDFRFFGSANTKEFPLTSQISTEKGTAVQVDAAALLDVVSAASRFTGKDELRPVMSGVCLDFRADGLHVAASDSKVLFADVIHGVSVDTEKVIIVNTSVVTALVSHGVASGMLDVSFDGRQVCFRQDGILIQGRLIDGKYPRFESVIPKNNNRTAVIGRQALSAAVKRVSISANKTTNQVRMRFSGTTSLTLEASDIDFSLHSQFTMQGVPQENFPGEHLTAVRAGFLLSVLASFPKDVTEIVMLLGDPTRAMLIKSSVDSERICLVMPMQVLE